MFVETLPAQAPATASRLERHAGLVAAVLSVAVLIAAFTYGSFAVGGSDSYGYVSQALLWERGDLHVEQALASRLPWRNAIDTLMPLGYTPASDHELVPTYPAGLPLLMVLFRKLFGPDGHFYVVPVFGALATWLTYLLGRALTGRARVGLAAATVLAATAPFLYQLMLPMSDVPVAALWTLVLLLALARGRGTALACGLAAAVAILVRPNLAPLAAPVCLAFVVRARRSGANALSLPALFALGVLPGPAVVAIVNHRLYGSPFKSGYGELGFLFSWSNVIPNAGRYTGWLFETGSVLVLIGMVAAFIAWPRPIRRNIGQDSLAVRIACAGFVAIICALYLPYLQFDTWPYLRFLLPVFPLCAVLAVASVLDLLERVKVVQAAAVVLILAGIVGAGELARARQVGAFTQQASEMRYPRAGAYIRSAVPMNGIVFAMQHSGTVRYYSRREILRYDLLERNCLDRAVETLMKAGYHPYLLVDTWEEEAFTKRFSRHSALGRLDWPGVPVAAGVRLFDLAARSLQLADTRASSAIGR